MVLNQQAGTLVPSPEGFVEISRPKPAKAVANEASAQSLQRRRKLKEMLETKLAKQFGASSNPHVRAVIRAEADRALAKGRLAPDDVRELERNIKKSLNMITSGTFEDKKVAADSAPEYAKARVDWNSVYKYKLRHGDDSEREKLERETAARQLLNRQIRHQIAEKESLKRKEEEEEAAAVRKQEDARRRAVEKAEEEKRAYRQKVQHELELNREQQRQVEQRKRDEAELARLEDEKMLHELRAAQEATKLKRAREAVAKAKRLELAKEENEKSRRIKAEAKAKEDDEVARLDALWTQMLDEQEAKRTEQMRKTHARQAQLQQAYGQTAGADMAERARRDEMSMLQAQKEYMEQQEARERRDKLKFDEQQKDILRSLTEQMQLAEQRREQERQADREQASTDAANLRAAKEVESRLRAEARRRAVAHQGELVTHARLVKESQMAGMLNENYMNEADKLYNANLVRAVLQYESTGKLTPNLTVPM